jgi:hypothetical protein
MIWFHGHVIQRNGINGLPKEKNKKNPENKVHDRNTYLPRNGSLFSGNLSLEGHFNHLYGLYGHETVEM